MEENIGIGIIVGLLIASSLYVWNSDSFSNLQKTFLFICILFAPLQWISIILIKLYNHYQIENSQECQVKNVTNHNKVRLETAIENLKDLQLGGIISDAEFAIKKLQIQNQLTNIELIDTKEYIQLKNLFDSGVLTNDEFEKKIDILKSIQEKIHPVILKDTEIDNAVDISIWHKLTNYDKEELGKYITYEVQSKFSNLDKFEFHKLYDMEKYFIFSEISNGYYNSVEELILFKFNTKVKIN